MKFLNIWNIELQHGFTATRSTTYRASNLLLVIGLGFFAAVTQVGHAAEIVDTGAPDSYANQNWHAGKSIAGQFVLGEETTIESVFTYIARVGSTGTSTVGIWGNSSADLPDSTSILYSQSFDITSADPAAFQTGVSGVSWDLTAGTYWAVFTSGIAAARLGVGVASPMQHYADTLYGGWTDISPQQIAVEINGTVSEVPIPAAAWLFGSGLLGLAGIARRKKSV